MARYWAVAKIFCRFPGNIPTNFQGCLSIPVLAISIPISAVGKFYIVYNEIYA